MIEGVGCITTDYSQYSKTFIESIHWNSGGRVISSTYQQVLTDVTNSAEVVVIEDTLGITSSGGNVTIPNRVGYASFYYRYKQTTPSGLTYYTVTEIRTVENGVVQTFDLQGTASLKKQNGKLTGLTEGYTVAAVISQFKYPVTVKGPNGNVLSSSDRVPTGAVVYLTVEPAQKAVVVLKGDVNGDGWISTTDYLRIKNHFLSTDQLTGAYFDAADCNADGSITLTDCMRLKSHFLDVYDLFA
jgi:hypothetical protein